MSTRPLKIFAWILFLAPLLLAAPPAEAQPTGLCSSTCSPTASCSLACYDTGGPNFFSNCGDYGNCQSEPPCEDPKSVTTRSETTLINEQVTATFCHDDHWFFGSPWAFPVFYDYLALTYRTSIIRTTEYCDGTVTEQVLTSNTSSASCARRTGITCAFAWGPPPLVCAF